MNPFDPSSLSTQVGTLLERVAKEPLGLVPARALQRGGTRKRPTVCTGATNPLAVGVREFAAAKGNLIGIVDDAKAGSTVGSVPVVSSAQLAELRKRHPDLLLINSSMTEAGFAHFGRLAALLELDCVTTLHYYQLMRADGVASPPPSAERLLLMDDPLAFFDLTVAGGSTLLGSAGAWADQLSVVTMYHLLLYRLTFDPVHLSRASVGGLNARPGPNAYVFDTSLIRFTDDEYFVDGGAFRGETFEHFHWLTKGKCRMVHAFEPDPVNLAFCQARAMDLYGVGSKRIRCDGHGLWNEAGRVRFVAAGYHDDPNYARAASHFVFEAGATEGVPVVALDDVLEGAPTFIKLEVEGSELRALQGARRSITTHRPRLSIGIYHRPLDLFELPREVLQLNAGYKMYLRHHTPTDWVGTVAYGVSG